MMRAMFELEGYFVKRRQQTQRGDYQQYVIAKEEDAEENFCLRALLRRLPNQEIDQIRSGKFSHLLPSDQCIKEFRFLRQGQQECLVVIIDPSRERMAIKKEEMQLSSARCLKLILEMLLLMENLLGRGVRIRQQLVNYLQLWSVPGWEEELAVLSLKRLADQSKECYFVKQSEQFPTNLGPQELALFKDFLRVIVGKKHLVPTLIEQMISLFETKIGGKIKIYIKELVIMLLELKVQFEKFSFTCLFDITKRKLHVRIYNQLTASKLENTVRGIIEIDRGSRVMSAEQLYFSFLANKDGRIKVLSDNSVEFWDENRENWAGVVFDPREQFIVERQKGDETKEDEEQKGQQLGVISSEIPKYPMNSIVFILVYFKEKYVKPSWGTGVLVDWRLVLTCAHILQISPQQRQKRKLPFERGTVVRITVRLGGQQVQAANWAYPEPFTHNVCRHANDFALVSLKNTLTHSSTMKIAQNFKTQRRIKMAKIHKSESATIYRAEMQESSQLTIFDEARKYLPHSMDVKEGNSGSPVIVILCQSYEDYYVIAIHSGKFGGTPKSIRITEQVLASLIVLQQKLTNSTSLEHKSLSYESLVKDVLVRLKDKEKEMKIQTIEAAIKETRRRIKPERDAIYFRNTTNEKCQYFRQQFFRLFAESFKFTYNTVNSQVREKFMRDMDTFMEMTRDQPFGNVQVKEYRSIFEQLSKQLKKINDSIESIDGDFKFFQNMVQDLKPMFTFLGIKWEWLAIGLKSLKKGGATTFQFSYIFCNDETIGQVQRIFQIISPLELTLKLQNEVFLKMRFLQIFKLNKKPLSESLYTLPCSVDLTPFSYFRIKDQYPYNNTNYFGFEYQLEFQTEAHLEQYLWEYLSQTHSLLCYPTILSKEKPHCLRLNMKFDTNFFPIDLLNYMAMIGAGRNLETLFYKLRQITEKVMNLHKNGHLLCGTVESIILCDQGNDQMFFSYFGSHLVLYDKIVALQKRMPLMTPEEVCCIEETYPVDRIIQSKGRREEFIDIDIWMLGQSFVRFINACNGERITPQIKESINQAIQLNINRRCRLQVLLQLFIKMIKLIRNR